MKIVFLDTMTVGAIPEIKLLDQLGNTSYYSTTKPEETLSRVCDAEIIITNKVKLDAEIISQCPSLKMICIAATGMNNVDRSTAENRGIVVKNVSDYSTNSVAQGTFALILSLLHQINYYDQYVKNGHYSSSPIFTNHDMPFWEMSEKRFGIIGMGNIGRRVAHIATAFGAEVMYHSTSGQNQNQQYLRLGLDELLETSDIVSIHAPLNEKTAGLINYDRLCKMKCSAILVNAGRGGIVNEADLAKTLDEGIIAGACIDVYSKEPVLKGNPLLKIKNPEKILLLPHVTWASIESRTSLIKKVIHHVQSFINAKELTSRS